MNFLDRLIYFIKDLKEKLKSVGGGSIPYFSQKEILILICIYCMRQLVESYSKIKKV